MPDAVIYPPTITTDKDKLFACYSLLEQMRLEYNKASVIASGNPEQYIKTGKLRAYADIFKSKQQQLLIERNHLRKAIISANYTDEQWETVNKLSPEEQYDIHLALFGDKQVEKVLSTKATATALDEVKALNLDDMPSKLDADPTEDFTTYTEVDEGFDITKTADRITFANLQTRSDTFYVYKDKTLNHFAGDFEHRVKAYVDAIAEYGVVHPWGLSNAVGDSKAWGDASTQYTFIRFYRSSSAYPFFLVITDGTDDHTGVHSIDTLYFITIIRDDDGGDGDGSLTIYLCTVNYYGEDGSNLEDTLSCTDIATKRDYQYIYASFGYDDGSANKIATGYVEDLDLQEGAPTTLELRSSTDTDASIVLDTVIRPGLRSSTVTSAIISLDSLVAINIRSPCDTDIRLSLDTGIGLALRSSSDTDARLSLSTSVEIALRASTATAARLELTLPTITLELRSSSDTRADISLQTGVSISLRSSTDTRAALTLDTEVSLALSSQTDSRAAITLTTIPSLELRSATDTRALIILSVLISLGLRSSTATRAALALIVAPTLELRSITATRAAIELNTLITLGLLSQTATRAAIILVVEFITRHQDLVASIYGRTLTVSMPSRTAGMKVRQDNG